MERVNVADLTAERLFNEHIKQRTPLVISGVPTDSSFKAFEKWTDIEYLKTTAGAAPVKVEPMHAAKKQYGTNTQRINTTFGAFLSSLEEKSEVYNYLTTQYTNEDEDNDDEKDEREEEAAEKEAHEAFPQPIKSLIRDVPLKPDVMGNLVLQQMNLWVGRSEEGASSGLHHDFHDNLYILLRGRKRFVLFPPESVEFFKPYGKVETVHGNGLIVYKGPAGGSEGEGEDEDEDEDEDDEAQGNGLKEDAIRADGLNERDAAGLRVKALERKIEALTGVEGKEDELEGLEEIYDEAVEHMMDFMMDEAEGMEEGDFFNEDDGVEWEDEELDGVMEKIGQHLEDTGSSRKRKAEDELEGPQAKANKSDDEQEDDDDDEDDEEGGLDGLADDDNDEDDEEEEELKAALKAAQSSTAPNATEPTEPLSFSQIPTHELHHHLGLKKPQTTSTALSKAPKPLIVELKAGDMLYLPTSWWHEVTSFSSSDDKEIDAKKEASIHMALNYWFHPPDQLDSFKAPYEDDLVWEYMEENVRKAYDALVKA